MGELPKSSITSKFLEMLTNVLILTHVFKRICEIVKELKIFVGLNTSARSTASESEVTQLQSKCASV